MCELLFDCVQTDIKCLNSLCKITYMRILCANTRVHLCGRIIVVVIILLLLLLLSVYKLIIQ